MKKIVLCIMDGVGVSLIKDGNALINAKTPTLDYLFKNYPYSLLEASGEQVGLPEGQMGNSEVGHMNIGAGRIVYQPLERINHDIKEKTFQTNPQILEIINHAKKNNSKLHIMGLLSDGGIHSQITHLEEIIKMIPQDYSQKVYLHMFLDGRDTPIDAGKKYLERIEQQLTNPNIKIATICGRYYAMDRDNRYDRIEKAYNLITKGQAPKYSSAIQAWQNNQDQNITDEFTEPSLIDENGLVQENDGIIVFNYRPDRLRELFSAFTNPNFQGFERPLIKGLKLVTMMPVSNEVICTNAYDTLSLENTLGTYLDSLDKKQLRIAETEKYAHVTYFFDGGKEYDLKGSKRILIPSPKVATYDLTPEMSANEITDNLIKEAQTTDYDLIVLNFANGDMIGHTGKYDKAVIAVETVDRCLEKLIKNLKEYTFFVTADHGNCEKMLNADNSVHTAHTTNLVPFIITDKEISLNNGKLADIAPTILSYLDLKIPKEMTGNILIQGKK